MQLGVAKLTFFATIVVTPLIKLQLSPTNHPMIIDRIPPVTNDLRVPRSRAAFTLVELLVVIAIIGILVWRALASRAGGEVLPE